MRWAPLLLLLAACGPMSLADAQQLCVQQAQLAQHPRGTIGMGVTNHGFATTADVTVSSDFLAGRKPDDVYASCMRARTGQEPLVPFSSLPDARM